MRTYLFDFDGTLVDSMPTYAAVMISVLEEAKNREEPVIVHALTKKGLGYSPAQMHPERFHSTGGFALNDTDDGVKQEAQSVKTTFTSEFSEFICGMAEENKNEKANKNG